MQSKEKALPVYGNGKQVRDWLYVDDHAKALLLVALKGEIEAHITLVEIIKYKILK